MEKVKSREVCLHDESVVCLRHCVVCDMAELRGSEFPPPTEPKDIKTQQIIADFRKEQIDILFRQGIALGKPIDKKKIVVCPFDYRFMCPEECPVCTIRKDLKQAVSISS